VLQQVCGFGESTARQVLDRIARPLAYTTVMTTMTRLYRKGLLSCRLSGKTFIYGSRLSVAQLELQLAHDLVKALVACDAVQTQELAAAIVEAIRSERPQLLQELKRALHEADGVEAAE
jgi:predicted transcriptional regulator